MIKIIDALCDRVFEIAFLIIILGIATSCSIGVITEATGSCNKEEQNVVKENK